MLAAMMTRAPTQTQTDLFGDVPQPDETHATMPPANDASTAASAQALRIVPGQARLSPAQQRFNKLLSRVANLQRSQAALDALVLRWAGPHQQTLATLQQASSQCMLEMLLFLHERLQRPGLTQSQRKNLREMVRLLVEQMEPEGHPQVLALVDLYISEEERALFAEDQEADLAELREMLTQMAGRPIEGLDEVQDPEEMLAMLGRQMQREQQARQSKLDARRAARKAAKGPSARERQAAAAQQDARTALRTVFRQLASALHPDRETDPEAREHKTRLMSEANAAYERQDLSTLLRLQLEVAQISPESLARMADEKLAAMSLLLKEQVAALEADLRMAEARASQALGFAISASTPEAVVARQVEHSQQQMREMLQAMRDDLQQVQEDEGLKRWLKTQKAIAKERAQRQAMDFSDFF